MDKKTTWGIIALVAVLVIVGIVFMVDREEPVENGEIELVATEGEDFLWDVEEELFDAYDLVWEIEEDLTEEEIDDIYSRYDSLEQDLWNLEEAYFEGEMDEDELDEELNKLFDEIQDFINDLEEYNPEEDGE